LFFGALASDSLFFGVLASADGFRRVPGFAFGFSTAAASSVSADFSVVSVCSVACDSGLATVNGTVSVGEISPETTGIASVFFVISEAFAG
jgi:hypothetical protein